MLTIPELLQSFLILVDRHLDFDENRLPLPKGRFMSGRIELTPDDSIWIDLATNKKLFRVVKDGYRPSYIGEFTVQIFNRTPTPTESCFYTFDAAVEYVLERAEERGFMMITELEE